MQLKHIWQYGIELEGCWDARRDGHVHDGSVRSKTTDFVGFIGELPSPPFSCWDKFTEWYRANYPIESEYSPSCGGHIHISFRTMQAYCATTSDTFMTDLSKVMCDYAVEHPEVGPELLSRFQGNNDYAKLQSKWRDQAYCSVKAGQRYTMVNYPHRRYSTIEVRAMPMSDNKEALLLSIEFLLEWVDTWVEIELNRQRCTPTRICVSGDIEGAEVEVEDLTLPIATLMRGVKRS
jgi:hypothetical protein